VRVKLRKELGQLRGLFESLSRDLRLLFVSNLVGSFGDGLYAYLLPIYIQAALHADPVDVGALYTVLTLSAALTPIPGGYLAELEKDYDFRVGSLASYPINIFIGHSLDNAFSSNAPLWMLY